MLISGCIASIASAQIEGNKKAQAQALAPWQHIKYLFTSVGLKDIQPVLIPIRMSNVSAIKNNKQGSQCPPMHCKPGIGYVMVDPAGFIATLKCLLWLVSATVYHSRVTRVSTGLDTPLCY